MSDPTDTLLSAHRLPSDRPPPPDSLQHLTNQVSTIASQVSVLTSHVEELRTHLPRRGVERALLAVIVLLLALILGAMIGLVWEAHRIVAALPG